MPFVKGQSGNPTGRPKIDPERKKKKTLVKEAWEALASRKPWLIEEALERGLTGGRPLGFLELVARLNKEIGQNEDSKPQVTIVVNSPIQANALRPIEIVPLPPAPQAHPALPEPKIEDAVILLENGGDDK